MKYTLWMFLLCPVAFAGRCPASQAKNNDALIHIEQTWAHALEQRDSATLDCILADEFEDAGPEGTLTNRATTLARADEHPAVHHDLTDLQARVQGDFGYIRGLATTKNAQGKVVIRVRFTDVYVYREGRWQCVAGHESKLTE